MAGTTGGAGCLVGPPAAVGAAGFEALSVCGAAFLLFAEFCGDGSLAMSTLESGFLVFAAEAPNCDLTPEAEDLLEAFDSVECEREAFPLTPCGEG